MYMYTGLPTVDDNPIQTEVVVAVSVVGCLLLLLNTLFCIFKQRRASRREADATKTDDNAIYGNYSDPDARMEVVDTNDYYSSDYEAGTGTSCTTDNNPYYYE